MDKATIQIGDKFQIDGIEWKVWNISKDWITASNTQTPLAARIASSAGLSYGWQSTS
jgi:hypothetical protein